MKASPQSFDAFLLRYAARSLLDEATTAKLVLRNYDTKYAPLVARAYTARPSIQNEAKQSWAAAVSHVERAFKQIESRLEVSFVDDDPYETYDQMKEEVEHTGILKVYKGFSDTHPVWSEEQNWKFRAVHDYQSHLAGGHKFGLRGELASYNRHIKTFPKQAYACLFTEIIGQVSWASVHGTFPEQKVALLYGFDYVNIGTVDEEDFKKNFDSKRKPPQS